MGFSRFFSKKLGFCSSPIVEAAKSYSSSSSIVSFTATSTSISAKSKLIPSNSLSSSLPRVIYLPASPSSTSLISSRNSLSTSSSSSLTLISSTSPSYPCDSSLSSSSIAKTLISSPCLPRVIYLPESPSSSTPSSSSSPKYAYDSYSTYKFYKIFRSDFPRVVEVDEHVSYLFLTRRSDPIPALTDSIPLYGKRYAGSRYAYRSIPFLTKPPFWLPPREINDSNREFVITCRPATEGRFRLTADASLKYEDEKLKIIDRAGGGFIIRDSGMNPVCYGEIMFSKLLHYDIKGFELLILAFALKSIGASLWFPLEVSSDNAFVIDMLNSKWLWELRHDFDALLATRLYNEELLHIYQKLMLTIEAQLIVSPGKENGEKWTWDDVTFTRLPREANHAGDFLANTIQEPGAWRITLPDPGCSFIHRSAMHHLLLEILDRDVYGAYVHLPVPGRKSRKELKALTVLARDIRRCAHFCSACGYSIVVY